MLCDIVRGRMQCVQDSVVVQQLMLRNVMTNPAVAKKMLQNVHILLAASKALLWIVTLARAIFCGKSGHRSANGRDMYVF